MITLYGPSLSGGWWRLHPGSPAVVLRAVAALATLHTVDSAGGGGVLFCVTGCWHCDMCYMTSLLEYGFRYTSIPSNFVQLLNSVHYLSVQSLGQ